MLLILAVFLVIMIFGTCLLVMYMLLVMQEQKYAWTSVQLSQSCLGNPVPIIFWDTPLSSSRIHPSAACIHGEWGLVYVRWQSASLSFCLKSPSTCSIKLSAIMDGGTPSQWNISVRVLCASPFCFIGCAQHHPKDVVYT